MRNNVADVVEFEFEFEIAARVFSSYDFERASVYGCVDSSSSAEEWH
jgi:hypothetical protein